MSLERVAEPHAVERFRHPVRVYWEDTDAGGVVFYANYLKFLERARTEWLRSMGVEQERLRRDAGVMFMVTDTSVRYLKPARLDDVLEVSVALLAAGQVRLAFSQRIWRRAAGAAPDAEADVPAVAPDELVAEGTIRIACVDAGTYRPSRIPIFLTRLLAEPQATSQE